MLGLLTGCAAMAQEPPCGIRTMTETVAPVCPPIARAAHVSGVVVLVATFDLQGGVTEVHAVSGPAMLRESAATFVRGWRADAYSGPRSCPVVVEYVLAGAYCTAEEAANAGLPTTERTDTQHYRVSSYGLALCDPSADVTRRKRFWLF